MTLLQGDLLSKYCMEMDGYEHLPQGENEDSWESIDVIVSNIANYRNEALNKLKNTSLLDDLTQLLMLCKILCLHVLIVPAFTARCQQLKLLQSLLQKGMKLF